MNLKPTLNRFDMLGFVAGVLVIGFFATAEESKSHDFDVIRDESLVPPYTPIGLGRPAPSFLLHRFAGTRDDGHDAHPDKPGFTRNGLLLGECFQRGFGLVVVLPSGPWRRTSASPC